MVSTIDTSKTAVIRSRLAGVAGHPVFQRSKKPHRVLGLPSKEVDPVRIILAAQLRLRGLRRMNDRNLSSQKQDRIREVVAARESLLMLALLRGSNPLFSLRGEGHQG